MNRTRTLLVARDMSVAACPVIVLVLVRMWHGAGGPATASAAQTEAAVPVAGIVGRETIGPLDREALYLRTAAEVVKTDAPDIFPRTEQPDPAIELPVDEPVDEPFVSEPQEVLQPAPDLLVTSIMEGRIPVAVIDGKAHRVGDRVGPGWSIIEISTGRVTIGHLDGRTRVFTIDRAGP